MYKYTNDMNSIEKIIKFVNPMRGNQVRLGANLPSLANWVFHGIKANQKDIALVIGVFLISLISFAGGYLAAKDQLKGPIQIESPKSQVPNSK